jgi:CubicO group peptidase (beta-lactamase class C family)
MNPIQQRIQEALDQLVEAGVERGLQVAVYHNGTMLVDAVAGIADPSSGRPVTSDTPFFSYSVGKGVAATVVHVLAERGASTMTPRSSSCGRSSARTASSGRPCATP